MELPPYKRPLLRVVARHMWDRSRVFLRRAGTVILGINIILWALATYPKSTAIEKEFAAKRHAITLGVPPSGGSAARVSGPPEAGTPNSKLAELDKEETGAKIPNSFAGQMGRTIEPIIAPLGFDWKMSIGI